MKDTQPLQILLLNTKQVAQALQVSERYIYDLMADGQLSSLKIGNARRFELAEVKRLIADRAAEQNQNNFAQERGILTETQP